MSNGAITQHPPDHGFIQLRPPIPTDSHRHYWLNNRTIKREKLKKVVLFTRGVFFSVYVGSSHQELMPILVFLGQNGNRQPGIKLLSAVGTELGFMRAEPRDGRYFRTMEGNGDNAMATKRTRRRHVGVKSLSRFRTLQRPDPDI